MKQSILECQVVAFVPQDSDKDRRHAECTIEEDFAATVSHQGYPRKETDFGL